VQLLPRCLFLKLRKKWPDPSAADLYPDADKWLTKMLEWAPNDSEGWYYLGRTKYNENRFAEAIRAFQ
jgi:cytochrome c-type biogenesis protein CcmH/NrfG